MKILIVFCLWPMISGYTDVDDSYDFDEISKDTIKFKKVVNCFIDKEPCSPELEKFKQHEYEVVADACKECNGRQKHTFIVFLEAMKKQFPEEFEMYQNKYDLDRTHFLAIEKSLLTYM